MAKVIDYFALTLIMLALTFVWSTLAFGSWVGALIFSAALTAIVVFSVKYFLSKRSKPYSPDRLALEFAIRGSEYTISLIKQAAQNAYVSIGSNYIEFEGCVLISAFKFSLLAAGDMGGLCKVAKMFQGKRIYVMTRGVDRRAYSIVQLENVKFHIVKARTIYKFLQKHGALPDLIPKKSKPSLRLFFDTIFSRSNFKSYTFSGLVLILVSFLTPLKIYYIVIGSLSLILAILTLTPLGNGTLSSPKVLTELEDAIKNKNQISIDDIL